MKIIVTGGTGRFWNILKKYKTNNKIIFPTKSQLNILNINKIRSFLVNQNQIFNTYGWSFTTNENTQYKYSK